MMFKSQTKARITDEAAVAELLLATYRKYVLIFASLFVTSIVLNFLLGYGVLFRFPVKQFVWTRDAAAVCDATLSTEPSISQARLKRKWPSLPRPSSTPMTMAIGSPS